MGETKLKLLAILKIINNTDVHHPLTAPQIADKLKSVGIEAERKSICRDINALIDSGYNIHLCTDKKQGYYWGDRDFANWELKILIDAVWQANFLDNEASVALSTKIRNLASDDGKRLLSAASPVKSSIKQGNPSIPKTIDTILNAITRHRKVQFQYSEHDTHLRKIFRKGGKYYKVNPHTLVWQDNRYYLICSHDEYNNLAPYRLDRMENIEFTEEPSREASELVGPNSDLQIESRLSQGLHHYSGDKIWLTILTWPYMIDEMVDYFGYDLKIKMRGEQSEISMFVLESVGLYFWLLQHCEHLEVIKPERIRIQLIEKLKTALNRYEKEKKSEVSLL